MRWCYVILLGGILCCVSCSPLEQQPQLPESLVDLQELPAEYGQLVAVVPMPNSDNNARWYELWFSDPDTGRIAFVPMYRPRWQYDPENIRVIERH